MEELMKQAIAELQEKKNAVIKEKFAEKGFGHLLENIEEKRFKRIVVEKHLDCEKWYADNGTDEGVLIVTFKELQSDIKYTEPNTYKLDTTIYYF